MFGSAWSISTEAVLRFNLEASSTNPNVSRSGPFCQAFVSRPISQKVASPTGTASQR